MGTILPLSRAAVTFYRQHISSHEEDAKALLSWFHLFGMTNLLQECDRRLSVSSPKFLYDDLNDVNHQRSTMADILVWAETAAIYGLSKILDAMMKELKKAVNDFPEMITTEILEGMRPFWSTAAGTELWEAVKAILPDDVKSNQNDTALKADKLLFEIFAQSCKVPAQIRVFKSDGDFHAIVSLMKKYHSRPRIQQQGFAAFRAPILQNNGNNISSAVKDCIEVVVSAMTTHSNVSRVQEEGCLALGNLTRNDANRVSIAAKHVFEAIVIAMTKHRYVPKVQQYGCEALGNLTRNDANRVSIAAKHVFEAIVSAMTTHSNVSKVQQCGCEALANLACDDVNSVSIEAKHGIEAIVSAMTAHSSVSTMQEYGCLALGNLACHYDANRVSIAAKHGIEAILSAMTTHRNVSNVQDYGCLALGNLAWKNDANCASIAAKYGTEAIVRAMTAHSNVSNCKSGGVRLCSTCLSTNLLLSEFNSWEVWPCWHRIQATSMRRQRCNGSGQ